MRKIKLQSIGFVRPLLASIRVRVTFLLLLLAIVPMSLSSYLSLQQTLDRIADLEIDNMERLAVAMADQITRFMGDIRQITSLASRYDDVQAFLETPSEPRRAAVEEEFHRVIEIDPSVSLVLLLDRAGIVIATSEPSYLGRNYAFREYFQAATPKQVFVSDITIGTVSGTAGVFFSRAVTTLAHGETQGVLVLKVKGEEFVKIMRHASSERHDAFIINGQGIILYHTDPALRYRSLMPLAPEVVQRLRDNREFLDAKISSLNLPDLAKTLVGAVQSGHTAYHLTQTGKDRIVGFAPVRDDDWVIGVAQNRDVFEAPIRQVFLEVVYRVAVTGLIAALFAAFLAGGIVRPLQRLTGFIGQHSGGELPPAVTQGLRDLGVRQPNEIGQLALTFLAVQDKLMAYLHEREAATAQRKRIESELAIAREIQLGLLRGVEAPAPDRRWTANPFILPAYEVGGDLYDFFENAEGQVYLLVGDVSGKGVPAALFMVIVRTLVRATALAWRSPAEILGRVNDELAKDNEAAMFVTLFLGLFDPASGVLEFANAGHLVPYWLRHDGPHLLPLARGGRALGVDAGTPLATGRIPLAPGDSLFLYTDGVTEATSEEGQLFGEARLVTALRQMSGLPAAERNAALLKTIKVFTGTAPQSDDLCLLIFSYRDSDDPRIVLS
ncbi:MAG: SpoIIE family protein phosphatase [Pseudomonadota bacterium]